MIPLLNADIKSQKKLINRNKTHVQNAPKTKKNKSLQIPICTGGGENMNNQIL